MGKPRTDQPPGPRGRWLVGNSYDYDRDRIGFLRRNQARYGDVFSFSPSTVVVCDPSLIHEIFNRSNEIFLAEAQVLASRREMIRAEANVENWMRSRRLGWQGMTRGVVRAHGRRVVTAFDAALSGTGGEFFDVMALMRVYSGRLVADLLFGTGADDVVAAADHRSTLALPFMNTNLTIPKWLPTPGVRRAVRAEDAVEAAIENHVRQRRANPHDESEDLLDLLLAEDDPPLEDAHIVQLLESTMLASLGSPGAVLAWVVLELARHPDIRERVREEAIELLSETGSVTDDNRLPYSKAFI
ncbi:MAG TPA: cytochrome P450, partial [Micromonosporaceae bacterium]|nr:cytochrome P450 [Micromonosporaceae bacterium]